MTSLRALLVVVHCFADMVVFVKETDLCEGNGSPFLILTLAWTVVLKLANGYLALVFSTASVFYVHVPYSCV